MAQLISTAIPRRESRVDRVSGCRQHFAGSRVVLAAGLLLLTACTNSTRGAASCGPPGCTTQGDELARLLSGPTLGLTFSVHTLAGGVGGPVTSAPARRYFVDLQVDQSTRSLSKLTSIGVDPRNRVIEKVRWQQGWQALRVADESDCVERDQPLPTAPDIIAVVEDMIGPLRPGQRRGAQRVSPGVYEYRDGPSTVRLVAGDAHLRGRTLEIVGRAGAVVSRTSDIALVSDSVIPARLRDAPCRRDPRNGGQRLIQNS